MTKNCYNSKNQILQYSFTLYLCYRSVAPTDQLDSESKTCHRTLQKIQHETSRTGIYVVS